MSFLADVIKHCSYSLNSSIKSWYLLGGVRCGKATGERGLKGNWRHHLMCSWSDFDWPLHNNMANLPYGPWSPTFLLSPGFTPAFTRFTPTFPSLFTCVRIASEPRLMGFHVRFPLRFHLFTFVIESVLFQFLLHLLRFFLGFSSFFELSFGLCKHMERF